MKSDAEIKEWIDSREAITRAELIKFIYGYKTGNKRRAIKWWDYILKTKNWEKQRKYREKRINEAKLKYPGVSKILKTDKRFSNIGYKKSVKLLQQIYNIKIGKTTIRTIKLKLIKI